MIGTSGATWLACLLFLLIAVIGAVVGYFASRILRKTWGIRTAAADGAIAIAVAFVYGYVATEIQIAHGTWQDISEQTIIVGAGGVILKHALQAALRSRHRT
jgi:hypothetical protein